MNEQAFPQNTVYLTSNGQSVQQGPQGGMTLRDYFAAKAMQGDWAAGAAGETEGGFNKDAMRYYSMADAMIKAREA